MRLGIMIKDAEYRDALVQKLCNYDNNIFVNIIDKNLKDAEGSVILTDVSPKTLSDSVLSALRRRTVFVIDSFNDSRDDCNTVFKFSSIPEIISKLSLVYDKWQGVAPSLDHTAKLIAVCSESDAYSADRCRHLAGQIIYSQGGSVLILPLSYINDYGVNDTLASNSLSKLLYSVRCSRERYQEGITFTDNYGVSSLLLNKGRNPVAYLDEDELRTLIYGLSKKFDTIIADIASCFRSENLAVMEGSDHILFFERGRRSIGIESFLNASEMQKFIRIRLTGGTEDVVNMDDCLKQIYGKDKNESIKGRNYN